MNRHLLLFLALVPVSFFAMEEDSLYKKIAQKKVTYEEAISFIEKKFSRTRGEYLPLMLMVFSCTYLPRKEGKTYKQMKQELDYYNVIAEHAGITEFITVMKKAIDNWDTANPENVFKYTNETDKWHQNYLDFLKNDYSLGLKDPMAKKNNKTG
jgi:hypothetical protein